MIGDDLMSKETKKEFIDTVKIIRKGELGWWDYEKDAKMIENSIRDEARDIGHQEGYKEGKRKGEIEGRKYNVPISVDTIRRRYPIKWTYQEGMKSLIVDTKIP